MIRESYLQGRDRLVPVTLLAVAVILAFVAGAVFAGVAVYCACDQRRKDGPAVPRKDKDKELAVSRRGSAGSVVKLGGLFDDAPAKEPPPEAVLAPLMPPGKPCKAPPKTEPRAPDLAALPTPEATPTLQPKRRPGRGSREWERGQNLLNACAPDLAPLGSPVIPTDLPARGPGPGVLALPAAQAYARDYAEQPPPAAADPAATLEYQALHDRLQDGPPPKVPQREASLGAPVLPHNGLGASKRLELHPSPSYALDFKRAFPTNSLSRAHHKRGNTNSSNSSHLARNPSFGRGDLPPPAPQRVDSIQATVAVARQPSLNAYSSLSRAGLKRTASLKPDVPPKPSFAPLAEPLKPSDACT